MPITHLIFDLDGTLYPNNNGIWDAIASRMEEYMHTAMGFSISEIPEIREGYFHQYGTTLKGLMEHHNVDPVEYLNFVHDIPLDQYLGADPVLLEILQNLPFPKWIFTNADVNHADRVLSTLGISSQFTGILGINSLDYLNKPDPESFIAVLKALNNPSPESCVFLDDIPKNLITAKQLGFHTILVGDKDPVPEVDQIAPTIYHVSQVLSLITVQEE